MHRPNNVDQKQNLRRLVNTIRCCARGFPVIFPVHPRTAKNLELMGADASDLCTTRPMSYLEFNYLVKNALAVITDSGGITEEATVLGVPCMTLRESTERPETITMGTNELVGTNPDNLQPYFDILFSGKWKKGQIPPLWDGKAAERIVRHLGGLL